MTKPNIADTRWAVDGSDADASNVVSPASGLRDTGWPFGAIPASGTDNYWQNRAYRWFQYLNAGNFVGNHTVSGTFTVGNQALTFATTTFTASSATDLITVTGHGLQNGDGPFRLTNSGGALPAPLTTGVDYWVIVIDANTFKLSRSFIAAILGIEIDITSNGTGTSSITGTGTAFRPTDATVSRTLTINGAAQTGPLTVGATPVTLASSTFIANSVFDTMEVDGHGLLTGDGPLRVSNSGGALPVPLTAGTDYYVVRSNDDKFSLATTRANAIAGIVVNLTTTGSGTNSIVSLNATRSQNANVSGKLTVGGWVTQGIQTAVVPHISAVNASGPFETSIPAGSGAGQGRYVAIASTVGRTLVAVRAYVAATDAALVGLGQRSSVGFIGAPPLGSPADIAGTLSSPSGTSGNVEIVEKSGLSVLFLSGVAYYIFVRFNGAGTDCRIEQLEYDWV